MANITRVFTSGETQVSRVVDPEYSEVFYVVTMYGDVTPTRLADLAAYVPRLAMLDDVEMVRGVATLQFVVSE